MPHNPAPGYLKHPGHRIELKPAGARVRITFNGTVVADTSEAMTLEEDGYPAVYYIPRGDVKMDLFARTAHRTHCPFKGDASYYSLSVGGKQAENAAWSYEAPYDEVSAIKEHLAFYADKVDSIAAG